MKLLIDVTDAQILQDIKFHMLEGQTETDNAIIDMLYKGIRIADRPAVLIDGKLLYITQGHIDAMVEYEREQARQEAFEQILNSLGGKEDGK